MPGEDDVEERLDWMAQRDEHIIDLVDVYRVDCVLDVGAYVGEFASMLRSAGFSGLIHSFEPVALYAKELVANAALDPNWHTHEMALGRFDGVGSLLVVEGRGSTFLEPNDYAISKWPEHAKRKRNEVAVSRLDTLLRDLGMSSERMLLKTDTQGYDIEVFEGLGTYLSNVVVLVAEVSVIPIQVGAVPMSNALELYRRAGFGITGLFPVSIERSSRRVLEFDCVMAREGVHYVDEASH